MKAPNASACLITKLPNKVYNLELDKKAVSITFFVGVFNLPKTTIGTI